MVQLTHKPFKTTYTGHITHKRRWRSVKLQLKCQSLPPNESFSPGSLLDVSDNDIDVQPWTWQGQDQFDEVGDRKDLPPLPLPKLPKQKKRVVLVRHGQSTWNARNRVQGSSDFSVLTEEGIVQATTAANALQEWEFDSLFVSPLQRAVQTASIVWGTRKPPITTLPSLREIDLYSFQGLEKSQGRTRFADAYETWQKNPADFEIDGHAPVRELWYRVSLAWQDILAMGGNNKASKTIQREKRRGSPNSKSNNKGIAAADSTSSTTANPNTEQSEYTTEGGIPKVSTLVVAHNAVNQALVCTAVGLPPPFFRRIAQSNAAFTVIDFEWDGVHDLPTVCLERVNQFPEAPLRRERLSRSAIDRLVLISGSAGSEPVQHALSLLAAVGIDAPPILSVGTCQQQAADVITALKATISTAGDEGRFIVAVALPDACRSVLGTCLGQEDDAWVDNVGMREGGITIVNYRFTGDVTQGTVLCINYDPALAPF